ncbi:MAG: aspartate aminotransferase family protein [Ilumatobacteraceae bacterium]
MTSAGGAHLSQVWAKLTDLRVVRGHGCRVVDVNGLEYLDFTSGVGATSTGHAHPKVVEAIAEEAAKFIHAQINIYTHDLLDPLADRLAEITPEPIDTFYFASSSDEVLEAAVKLAKRATGRPNIVVFDVAFHGRTHLTMAMSTSRAIDREGYGPLPGGVYVSRFPDPHVSDQETEITRALAGFDRLLATQAAPSEIAAIVIEPVIGERGYIPTPAAFIEGLGERCREHGILFVADETQSGFGRTGRMFAMEAFEVEPDILCMAKGIASGFPFAALGTRWAIDDLWPPGSHGGTYNGNPIGCAAALATIDVLTEPGFLDNVNSRGTQLMDGLRDLQQLDEALRHVRGRGLMVATEFDSAERPAAIVEHCLKESNVILMTAGTRRRTIRWIPPLIVAADEVSEALAAFEAAMRATS